MRSSCSPEGGLGGGWFGNPSSCRLRLGPTSGSWVSPETRLYTRVREGRPCWAGRGWGGEAELHEDGDPHAPRSAPLPAWLTSPAAFCALESQACCCPLHVLTPCLAGRSPSVPAQTSAPRRGPLRHPPPPSCRGRPRCQTASRRASRRSRLPSVSLRLCTSSSETVRPIARHARPVSLCTAEPSARRTSPCSTRNQRLSPSSRRHS